MLRGADLEHVGIFGDDSDMLGGHDLGDDRQAGLSASRRQHFEAQLLVSLKAVGTGSRLIRTTAKAGGTERLELAGQAHDLVFTLDRTRAGDHGHSRPTDLQPACLDDGPLAFQLRGSTLVRSHDRQDLFDPFAGLEGLDQARPLFSQRGDDRLVISVNHLGLQPQRRDVIRHMLDLQRRCVRFHDYDHGRPSSDIGFVLEEHASGTWRLDRPGMNSARERKQKAPEPFFSGAGARLE